MGIMNISRQAEIFLITFLCGAALGLGYDVLRIPMLFFGRGWRIVSDMLFWVCAFASAFFVILYFNSGVMRFFEFAGIALGMLLYFLAVSPFLKKQIFKPFKRLSRRQQGLNKKKFQKNLKNS